MSSCSRLRVSSRGAQDGEDRDVAAKRKIVSKRPAELVDEVGVLAATGEDRLERVRQLIMRGMKLTSFAPACAFRLSSLTVLSLSNNSLRDLESLRPLVNLVEVNVNFNAVSSLQGLACPNLQRLYLSNNLIASTEKLAAFPKLRTLCLFKNILPNLASALDPLRNLPDLRSLDFDGNPCSQSRGYKHQVIRRCPRLCQLDGEELTSLDRDLSALFFEEQRTKMAWDHVSSGNRTQDGSNGEGERSARNIRHRRHRRRRPATAPATGVSKRLANMIHPQERLHGGGTVGNAENKEARVAGDATGEEDVFELGRLPFGQARLLTSDRLNDDPQLLCYLAQGALADPCASPRDTIESLRQQARARSAGQHRRGVLVAEQSRGDACQPGAGEEGGGGGEDDRGAGMGGVVEDEESEKETRTYEEVEQAQKSSRRSDDVVQGEEGLLSPPEIVVWEGEGGARHPRRSLPQQRGDEGERAGTTAVVPIAAAVATATTETMARKEVQNEGKGATESTGRIAHDDVETVVATDLATPFQLRDDPPPPPPPVAGLDPSNPYATIRKLLKLVEHLQLEVARRNDDKNNSDSDCDDRNSHRRGRVGAKDDSSNSDDDDSDSRGHRHPAPTTTREDLRRLRLENRNMHLLLVENRELKTQAREESARTERTRRELTAELEAVSGRLEEVTRELEVARGMLLLLQPPAAVETETAAVGCKSVAVGASSAHFAIASRHPSRKSAKNYVSVLAPSATSETGATGATTSASGLAPSNWPGGGSACSDSADCGGGKPVPGGRKTTPWVETPYERPGSGKEGASALATDAIMNRSLPEESEAGTCEARSVVVTEGTEKERALVKADGVSQNRQQGAGNRGGDRSGGEVGGRGEEMNGSGDVDESDDDDDDGDKELEELFRRNESTIAEIRRDLDNLLGPGEEDVNCIVNNNKNNNNVDTKPPERTALLRANAPTASGDAGSGAPGWMWKTSAILSEVGRAAPDTEDRRENERRDQHEREKYLNSARQHAPRTSTPATSATCPGTRSPCRKNGPPSSEPPSVSELLERLMESHRDDDRDSGNDGERTRGSRYDTANPAGRGGGVASPDGRSDNSENVDGRQSDGSGAAASGRGGAGRKTRRDEKVSSSPSRGGRKKKEEGRRQSQPYQGPGGKEGASDEQAGLAETAALRGSGGGARNTRKNSSADEDGGGVVTLVVSNARALILS